MIRILNPLVRLVALVPAPVQTKLLAAFLAIAALLVMVGAVGLEGFGASARRSHALAYRHSRSMVLSDTPMTKAASLLVRPAK